MRTAVEMRRNGQGQRVWNGLRRTIGRDGGHSGNPATPLIICSAMVVARRSTGVVLIVALLGWTVNRPMWCQSQHSRAASVVPAGASPAYKPEPSPSRHTCCPHGNASAVNSEDPASAICVHDHASRTPDCCSVSRQGRPGLPSGVVARSQPASVALVAVLASFVPIQEQQLATLTSGPPPPSGSPFNVLRL